MAWTITEASDAWMMNIPGSGRSELIEVTLTCTSDTGASDYDLASDIKGASLYLLEIIPGTGGDAPTAAFNLDIENESNNHILDTDSNAHTANSFVIGSATLGIFPPIKNYCSLVCATLGDANKAVFKLYFIK